MEDPTVLMLQCSGCGARYRLRNAPPQSRSATCKKCGGTLRPPVEFPGEEAEGALRFADEPEPKTWEIPVRLGKYVVEGEIARGGMGVVYKARQEGLDRRVAIKMMLPGPASSDEAVRRFRREARAAAKLRHPNIVAVHEIGDYNNLPFFSMDHVEGKSLDALLAERPVGPRRAAEIVRDIARAVHFAHEQGIVHRDLKPGNVLMDGQGAPRITDFGLAKQIDSRTMLSVTGDVLGTPAYMAPEQAEGRVHEVDASSDVYSLGALLYRVLTGKVPFEAPTLAATIYKVVHDYTTEPVKINPRLPGDLSAICMKALEKEKARRYASAEELGADLERFLRGEPVAAKPISGWDRLRRKIRKHRVAFRISAASIGIAVLAVLGLVLFGGESFLDIVERNLSGDDATVRLNTLSALLADIAADKFRGEDRDRALRLARAAIGRDTDARTRETVLSILERNPTPDLLPMGIAYLGVEEPRELLLKTIDLLNRHHVQEAADPMLALLRNPDHDVHHAAVRYFIAVPHLPAFGNLGNLIADPRCGEDARAAMRYLYDNGVMSFFSPATAGVGGAVGSLGESVAKYNKMLEEIEGLLPGGKKKPEDEVEMAMVQLHSSDAPTRMRAAIELGMHGDERAADALLRACEDADDAVARAAGVSLHACGAGKHREKLEALLDHDRPSVRIAAASALAGRDESISALAGRLEKEKDPEVRSVLRKAIQ